MAGTKNLYNADPLELVREALERANGLPLRHEYVDIALSGLGPTTSVAVITPRVVAGHTPYVDGISLTFPKISLANRLPKDMCYSGPWPATFEQFSNFMNVGYGLLILPNQWQIVHGGIIYTLNESLVLNFDYSHDRALTLSPTTSHPLFTTDTSFPLFITDGDSVLDVIELSIIGDENGQIGDEVNVQFIVTGGEGPYTFTLIEGSLPAIFNEEGDALEGTYISPGDFQYTIQVEDVNGLQAQATGTTEVILAQFGLTAPAPNGQAEEPYSHQYTFTGGLGPYLVTRIDALPAGLLITEEGLLHGWPDVGQQDIDVTFTDALGNRYTVRETIYVQDRVAGLLRVAVRESLVDWLELGGGYQSAYGAHSSPVDNIWTETGLIATNVPGTTAAGLKLIYGNLTRTISNSAFANGGIAVALWLKKGHNTRGGRIFSSVGAQGGFEISVGDYSDSQIRLTAKIDGVNYGLVTDALVEVLETTETFLVAQVFNGLLSLYRNGALLAWSNVPLPSADVCGNTFYLGGVAAGPGIHQWNGTLVTAMFFNKRLWGDEIAYLYQTGAGRQYAELRDNFDYNSEVIRSNQNEIIECVVGQNQTIEVLFTGTAQILDPVLYEGSLPPGLSLSMTGPFRWLITGTPTTEGTFVSEWAITASELYSAQHLVFQVVLS